MSTLTLTLREPPVQRLDLSPLSPDRLTGRTAADVGAIELSSGNRRLRVDSLFTVAGAYASVLEIRNSCDKLDRIGEAMTGGRVVVQGDAGAYLGARMKDGSIEVQGNVGAYGVTGMRGGFVHIKGNAGDFLAGAIPGDPKGMQGGTVVVMGHTGERTGDRMRRGTLLIEGNTGDYCASRMVAGTIAVGGKVGRFPGLQMRRGTLILRQAPGALVPTFSDCGEHPLGFLTLLARSWRSLPGAFSKLPDTRPRVRRYMGDLANDGRGEILIWV